MKIIILIATLTISSFSMGRTVGSLNSDYVICVDKNVNDLVACVNNALRKGFEAQGSMVLYGDGHYSPRMYQTLVRR